MAKKYLLYIHHDRFQDEPKKSKLVNDLLDKHYTGTPSPGVRYNPKIAPVVVNETEKLIDAIAKLKDEEVVKPCKHGYPPAYCKHAKPGKPCK